MAMAHWEMHAWITLMLGWFFVPFSYQSKVFTMPEFPGLFNRRVNAKGAVWGLGVGFALGMAKLTIQALFGATKTFTSPAFLVAVGDFNFLYFSGVLFFVSVAVILIVSYLTAPPDQDRIKGLTYASLDKQVVRASWNGRDLIATGAVLTLIIGMYLYFSFWL